MSRPGTWVEVTIKVAKDPHNEVPEDEWTPPNAADVATEVRKRMEDMDLDTGWTIVSVSS